MMMSCLAYLPIVPTGRRNEALLSSFPIPGVPRPAQFPPVAASQNRAPSLEGWGRSCCSEGEVTRAPDHLVNKRSISIRRSLYSVLGFLVRLTPFSGCVSRNTSKGDKSVSTQAAAFRKLFSEAKPTDSNVKNRQETTFPICSSIFCTRHPGDSVLYHPRLVPGPTYTSAIVCPKSALHRHKYRNGNLLSMLRDKRPLPAHIRRKRLQSSGV